mgnify:CR=1 FL=1
MHEANRVDFEARRAPQEPRRDVQEQDEHDWTYVRKDGTRVVSSVTLSAVRDAFGPHGFEHYSFPYNAQPSYNFGRSIVARCLPGPCSPIRTAT